MYFRFGLILTVYVVSVLWVMGFCIKRPEAQAAGDYYGRQIYEQVRGDLERVGATIDYDTLVKVYHTLAGIETVVPHVDELLFDLMKKRNKDSRVDQMVVILGANIIARSKYPIDNVSALFETILRMDGSRINNWVLIYVGDAMGRYLVDLPDGGRLADLLEARVDQAAGDGDDDRETFGHHFLPPPKSQEIVGYIEGIKDQDTRQKERNAYYLLISQQHSESEIAVGLRYLRQYGPPGKTEKCSLPLRYLVEHWEAVRDRLSAIGDSGGS